MKYIESDAPIEKRPSPARKIGCQRKAAERARRNQFDALRRLDRVRGARYEAGLQFSGRKVLWA